MKFVPLYLLPQLASTIKLKKGKNVVKKLSKYVKICQKGVKEEEDWWLLDQSLNF
jgi:hypothetical protein